MSDINFWRLDRALHDNTVPFVLRICVRGVHGRKMPRERSAQYNCLYEYVWREIIYGSQYAL